MNYHKAITERFKTVMFDIITTGKKKRTGITSVSAFARSIGYSSQNLGKYFNHFQGVSTPVIEAACRKYRINPTWLILGEGEMYLKAEKKKQTLEERVKKLESLIK